MTNKTFTQQLLIKVVRGTEHTTQQLLIKEIRGYTMRYMDTILIFELPKRLLGLFMFPVYFISTQ